MNKMKIELIEKEVTLLIKDLTLREKQDNHIILNQPEDSLKTQIIWKEVLILELKNRKKISYVLNHTMSLKRNIITYLATLFK